MCFPCPLGPPYFRPGIPNERRNTVYICAQSFDPGSNELIKCQTRFGDRRRPRCDGEYLLALHHQRAKAQAVREFARSDVQPLKKAACLCARLQYLGRCLCQVLDARLWESRTFQRCDARMNELGMALGMHFDKSSPL